MSEQPKISIYFDEGRQRWIAMRFDAEGHGSVIGACGLKLPPEIILSWKAKMLQLPTFESLTPDSESCPRCQARLRGEAIPTALRRYYGGRTHYSQVFGAYSRETDGTTEYACPHCGFSSPVDLGREWAQGRMFELTDEVCRIDDELSRLNDRRDYIVCDRRRLLNRYPGLAVQRPMRPKS